MRNLENIIKEHNSYIHSMNMSCLNAIRGEYVRIIRMFLEKHKDNVIVMDDARNPFSDSKVILTHAFDKECDLQDEFKGIVVALYHHINSMRGLIHYVKAHTLIMDILKETFLTSRSFDIWNLHEYKVIFSEREY